jgi:aminoglycoside phosphotransferase (APT) family kinase protein
MEQGWERSTPFIDLDHETISRLVTLALPAGELLSAERLSGGLVNTNYRIETTACEHPLVLRLYARDPERIGRESAVLAAVDGIVPAPRLLHQDDSRKVCPYPFVIETWLEGTLLQDVLDNRPDLLEAAGRSLGATAAAIGRRQFERPGFFAAHQPLSVAGELPSLEDHIERCLSSAEANERLGPGLIDELKTLVRENRRYLILDGSARLTHGDYKPSNLLIDVTTGSVSGVLDWEFAFAGPPLCDLATLMRGTDDLPPRYEASICAGFVEAGGNLPRDWKRRVRLLDFANLADFIGTAGELPERTRTVHRLLETSLRHWPKYPA